MKVMIVINNYYGKAFKMIIFGVLTLVRLPPITNEKTINLKIWKKKYVRKKCPTTPNIQITSKFPIKIKTIKEKL